MTSLQASSPQKFQKSQFLFEKIKYIIVSKLGGIFITPYPNQMLKMKGDILRHNREGKVTWFVIATLDGNWTDSLR